MIALGYHVHLVEDILLYSTLSAALVQYRAVKHTRVMVCVVSND